MARVTRRVVADAITQRALDAQRSSQNETAGSYIIDGRHIGDTSLPDGGAVVKIRHGLDGPIRGWIVTDLRGAASGGYINRVREDSANTPANDRTDLWLSADGWGADITVRIWVY